VGGLDLVVATAWGAMASDLGLRSARMSGTTFSGALAFSLFWNSTNLFDLFSTDPTDNAFLSHCCVGSARHSTSQQQHYSPQSPQWHRTLLHKLAVLLHQIMAPWCDKPTQQGQSTNSSDCSASNDPWDGLTSLIAALHKHSYYLVNVVCNTF